MYQYDSYDQQMVDHRVLQFAGQLHRRLSGHTTEAQFRPLRLQNGLYRQLHAYMLRVAVPYGLLSSKQLRKLAHIARTYDRGYGHFTTRQNIQFNWPRLVDVPQILEELASVQMHAIQTSGNCVRNVTSDPYAGVAPDELEDPRPYCELIRQWSTFHPEFAHLPRKFKIAVTGTPAHDRAAVRYHDIGLRRVELDSGERGFEVWVGGGLGRTPFVGHVLRDFIPTGHLLSYLESILRVYNLYGRRDNKFKARIKVLVKERGLEAFRREVEADWEATRDSALELSDEEVERVRAHFTPPNYVPLPDRLNALLGERLGADRAYAHWLENNVLPHKQPGYACVVLSLKRPGTPPGDVTDAQLDAIADIAERYSFSRAVSTHAQNLVLPDVEQQKLRDLYAELQRWQLATPNHGRITDSICCPGLDYCSLANARSIPVALELAQRFEALDYQHDIGPCSVKISGCINACGHHHVGHIGVLGIDKHGGEAYQLMLGGSEGNDASLGKVLGPALSPERIVDAIEAVVRRYLELRSGADETFLECLRRVGFDPFRGAVYG